MSHLARGGGDVDGVHGLVRIVALVACGRGARCGWLHMSACRGIPPAPIDSHSRLPGSASPPWPDACRPCRGFSPTCRWRWGGHEPGPARVAEPAGTVQAGRGAAHAPCPTTAPDPVPALVDALTGALRTYRDRAMIAAIVLGGLRRCEVLGLRFEDVRVRERWVFIVEGKGGHQRLVPASTRLFTELASASTRNAHRA